MEFLDLRFFFPLLISPCIVWEDEPVIGVDPPQFFFSGGLFFPARFAVLLDLQFFSWWKEDGLLFLLFLVMVGLFLVLPLSEIEKADLQASPRVAIAQESLTFPSFSFPPFEGLVFFLLFFCGEVFANPKGRRAPSACLFPDAFCWIRSSFSS